MTKFHAHSYTVIFDSSLLFGEPVARQVRELIEKYKTTDKVDIKIYIPEVVEKELERRILKDISTKHNEAVRGVRMLKTYFPQIKADIPDKLSEEQILAAKRRILQELGIEIIPTPIDKIDWQDAIARAARYELPFEEHAEKGFKDYVIAETAVEHFLSSKNGRFCMFLCHDGKMTKYLRERTAELPRFLLFDSVDGLISDIELRLDESTRKIADVLLQQAAQAFYAETGKDALFNFDTLSKRANAAVTKLLTSDEFKKRYPSYSIAKQGGIKNVQIAKPNFIDRPSTKTFRWQSVVVAEADLELAESDDTYLNKNLLLKTEIRIDWSASFSKKGLIHQDSMKVTNFAISSYDMQHLVLQSVDEHGSGLVAQRRVTAPSQSPAQIGGFSEFINAH